MGNFDSLLNLLIPITEAHGRFKVGEKSDDFNDVKSLRPIFSFEYACLDKSEYSFNFNSISSRDYHNLIDGLKDASSVTYEFMSSNERYHFHAVEWDDVDVSESVFYKCIQNPYKGVRDLTVYQFKVFKEARVFGFIYRSVFYLVLFDRNHRAYGRDRPQKRGRK